MKHYLSKIVVLIACAVSWGVPHLNGQKWAPPPPPQDDFDWIQLTSGEWLKGELLTLQDGQVEFDSEELDLVSFDEEDVLVIRLTRTSSVLFKDKHLETGTVMVTKSEVMVRGETVKTFPRSTLQAITPGEPKESSYWSGKISLGAAVRSGNTDQLDIEARINLLRRTPFTRMIFDYIGNTGTLNGQEEINNHRVNSSLDYYLNDRLFVRPLFAEYFRDRFQNVSYRLTVGAGMGYTLIDRPKREWEVFGGPAFQYTQFDSVEAGDSPDETTPAVVIGTVYDHELTSRLDSVFEYRGIWVSEDAGLFTHHAVVTLELEVTQRLDLDVSLVWDRIEKPKEDTSGELPDKNDVRLTLGLGYEF